MFSTVYWLRADPAPLSTDLGRELDPLRFRPLRPHQEHCAGFVETRLREDVPAALIVPEGAWLVGTLRTDTRKVPPQKVDAEVLRLLRKNGDAPPPTKDEMKRLRDEVINRLLPETYPESRNCLFAVHRQSGYIAVDASRQRDHTSLSVKLSPVLGDATPARLHCEELLRQIVLGEVVLPDGFAPGDSAKVRHPGTGGTITFRGLDSDASAIGKAIADGYIPKEVLIESCDYSAVLRDNGMFARVRVLNEHADQPAAEMLDTFFLLRRFLEEHCGQRSVVN